MFLSFICLLYTSLLLKAIGDNLVCVHVNHGLMRKGESEDVVEVFTIIFLGTQVDDYTANTLQAQLLYLSLIHISGRCK